MVGSHRADVDSLYSAHSAVVLYLDARKIPQGVGHAVGIESFQFVAGKGLGRNDVTARFIGRHHHLLEIAGAVGDGLFFGIYGRRNGGQNQ